MEDKEQTPPVQVPTEENNYKHIDAPAEGSNAKDIEDESGSPADILQEEEIIDPGNEHHHEPDESGI